MISETDLETKRKEYRESEIQNKIESYSKVSAVEFRQHTLKSNYTRRVVDKRLPKVAWFLIITQAIGITYFSSLYVLSYIPKTKTLVTKVMP
jgi:hypothetical protein